MRMLSKLAIATLTTLALSGAALAAESQKRVMDVPLPDGSTARIEYHGDVAPKVSIEPPAVRGFPGRPFPQFPDFDRIFERMDRQRDAIMRQMQRLPRHRTGPGATTHVASQGDLPTGATSVSIVSISNGAGTCTRTTQVTPQGEGKPPKVVTNVSGSCADVQSAPAVSSTADDPSEPLDHT